MQSSSNDSAMNPVLRGTIHKCMQIQENLYNVCPKRTSKMHEEVNMVNPASRENVERRSRPRRPSTSSRRGITPTWLARLAFSRCLMPNERRAERTNTDDGDSSDQIRRLRRRKRERVDDINPPTEAGSERRAFGRPTERSCPDDILEVGISQ